MRGLMFSVGSLGVAVGTILLLVALAANLLLARALTGTEMLIACIGSSMVGFFWWRFVRRKIKQQSLEAAE